MHILAAARSLLHPHSCRCKILATAKSLLLPNPRRNQIPAAYKPLLLLNPCCLQILATAKSMPPQILAVATILWGSDTEYCH